MISILVRRVGPLVVVAVLLVVLVLLQQAPPAQADLWFHLRFGQEFLDGWRISSPGNLGVFDTAQWIPTQWLSQAAMAWSVDRWGLDSVIWGTGVLVLSLVVLLFATCRRFVDPLPAGIAVVIGTIAAYPGFTARPQLLSYLFVVVTVAAWLATSRDGRVRYWLVLLAWLWPMCHGMWPVGISISAAAVAGMVLERRYSRRFLARAATIPLASLVVAALTPIGMDTYRSLVSIGSRSEYFAEWGAPDFTSPSSAVLAAMVLVVVTCGFRSKPVPWVHVTLTVLAIAWSLYSMRTTVVGALILTPLLAMSLGRLVPSEVPFARRERLVLLAMTLTACCALWPVVQSRSDVAVVPSWVNNRLDELAPGTPLLNDWDSGSFLLYRHPDLELVMHGYGDVFTDSEIQRNYDLTRLRPGWDDELADLQVSAALLDPQSPLGYTLEHVLGWEVEQEDDDFVFLVPPQT